MKAGDGCGSARMDHVVVVGCGVGSAGWALGNYRVKFVFFGNSEGVEASIRFRS